ncbi:MAG: tetratricopeptide repeat protein, partial [Sodaliphilus sp.]|nr:tetratricopeptide repeat protein [Sodaliphilus sp.]
MRLLIFIISSLMLVLGSCRSTQKTVAEIEGVSVEAMPTKPDTTKQRKTTTKRRRTKRKTHRQKPQSTTPSATPRSGEHEAPKPNIAELRQKAEKGDSVAQTMLGVEYMKGDQVEKDLDKAIEWWKKAAEKGYAEAEYKLGVCYHFGFGIKK